MDRVRRSQSRAKTLVLRLEQLQIPHSRARHDMTGAAGLVEENVGNTLTECVFPDYQWIKLRTNSPRKRIRQEIRRRTRVVGAFADSRPRLNVAGARLRRLERECERYYSPPS